MFDKTQLMRGSLEGCILKIIDKKLTYGYEIMEELKTVGFDDISEGSIYPILLRLEKQKNITSQLIDSPLGPKRKYYTISEEGKEYLQSFYECWKHIYSTVNILFYEEGSDSQ